jgi:hypothetical protein
MELSSALFAGGGTESFNSGAGGGGGAGDLRGWALALLPVGVDDKLEELLVRGVVNFDGTDEGDADIDIEEEVNEPVRVGVRVDFRLDFLMGVGIADSPLQQVNVSGTLDT